MIILFNNCDQIVDLFLHFGMKQYIFSVDHCQKVSVVKSCQKITSKKVNNFHLHGVFSGCIFQSIINTFVFTSHEAFVLRLTI